jgi:hypothetical protein
MKNCENTTVTIFTAIGLWKGTSHNNTTNVLLKAYVYAQLRQMVVYSNISAFVGFIV